MEGSEGLERIPDIFAAAGDIQAKPTRVSGGLDFLVIIIFLPRFQLILGQTHDEMENGKLATHISSGGCNTPSSAKKITFSFFDCIRLLKLRPTFWCNYDKNILHIFKVINRTTFLQVTFWSILACNNPVSANVACTKRASGIYRVAACGISAAGGFYACNNPASAIYRLISFVITDYG